MYVQYSLYVHAEPKITILDWLVKCPIILNFAWTYKKFGWTQIFSENAFNCSRNIGDL